MARTGYLMTKAGYLITRILDDKDRILDDKDRILDVKGRILDEKDRMQYSHFMLINVKLTRSRYFLLQRLVKYPLLLEQVAKYTDNSTGTSQVRVRLVKGKLSKENK